MLNADCIVSADYVLPMDESLSVLRNGAVAIRDAKISDIGESAAILKKYRTGQHIQKTDCILLPGLINTHTHAAMVYFRGIADDLPLNEWLNKHIWPAENRWLGPEFISDAIGLACLEMLKGGITAYNDMYFFEDEAGTVTKKMGMRAVLGSGVLDFPSRSGSSPDEYIANAVSLVEKWKGDELIVPCIAPHALYTCGPETLKRAKAVAEKYEIPVHIHLSETEWEVREVMTRYGKRPAEYLESLGFLDETVPCRALCMDGGQ